MLAEFSQFLPEASAYTSFSLGGPPPSKKTSVGTGVTKTTKGTRKVCILHICIHVYLFVILDIGLRTHDDNYMALRESRMESSAH